MSIAAVAVTAIAAQAIPAPIDPVTVPVVLPVVVGEEQLTIDAAIDRLAMLQDEERRIAAEREALRDAANLSLRMAGYRPNPKDGAPPLPEGCPGSTYTTAAGHTATVYHAEGKEGWDDAFLKRTLSAEALASARKRGKAVDTIRVR